MKARIGFVTNSSSSSFTMFINKTFNDSILDEHPVIKKMYNFLIKAYSDRDGAYITSIEELNKFYFDTYGYTTIEKMLEEEGDTFTKDYNEACKLINKGYIMLRKHVDYNDDEAAKYFDEIADGVDIIVWSQS